MRILLFSVPDKRPGSYVLESRFIFWNLLLTMLASSLLLFLYLRKILDF